MRLMTIIQSVNIKFINLKYLQFYIRAYINLENIAKNLPLTKLRAQGFSSGVFKP